MGSSSSPPPPSPLVLRIFLCFLVPAILSTNSLQILTPEHSRDWLKYWIVLSMSLVLEVFLDSVLLMSPSSYLSLCYDISKVLWLLWLLSPGCHYNGSEVTYSHIVVPLYNLPQHLVRAVFDVRTYFVYMDWVGWAVGNTWEWSYARYKELRAHYREIKRKSCRLWDEVMFTIMDWTEFVLEMFDKYVSCVGDLVEQILVMVINSPRKVMDTVIRMKDWFVRKEEKVAEPRLISDWVKKYIFGQEKAKRKTKISEYVREWKAEFFDYFRMLSIH